MGRRIGVGGGRSPFAAKTHVTRRGEDGAVLLFVLTMVLVLSISAAAILAMSLNSDVVAHNLQDSTKGQHRADGALEEAVNAVRNDTTSCVASAPYQVDGVSFDVACTPVSGAQPSTRVYNLTAMLHSDSSVVGLAQVKVIDWPTVGYKLEVCDWLLGRSVSASLNSCTNGPMTP